MIFACFLLRSNIHAIFREAVKATSLGLLRLFCSLVKTDIKSAAWILTMAVVSPRICNHSTLSPNSASIPSDTAVFTLEEHAFPNSFQCRIRSPYSLCNPNSPNHSKQNTLTPTITESRLKIRKGSVCYYMTTVMLTMMEVLENQRQ